MRVIKCRSLNRFGKLRISTWNILGTVHTGGGEETSTSVSRKHFFKVVTTLDRRATKYQAYLAENVLKGEKYEKKNDEIESMTLSAAEPGNKTMKSVIAFLAPSFPPNPFPASGPLKPLNFSYIEPVPFQGSRCPIMEIGSATASLEYLQRCCPLQYIVCLEKEMKLL